MENYILEIYPPNSSSESINTFNSNSPLMAIPKGDLLNPRTWNGAYDGNKLLKVVNIEHIIWENKREKTVRHKVCFFTREVEDNEAIREKE